MKQGGPWANLLTALRIPLALALPFLTPLGPAFLIIYAACCLTDILDGPVARRTGTQSKQGARLDSIADFVLAAALVTALYPVIPLPAGMIVWICIIAALRVASVAVAFVRFKAFAVLHTYGNKCTGFLLFLLPFCLALFPLTALAWVLCVAATLSALEELAIQATAESLDLNRKSIFVRG